MSSLKKLVSNRIGLPLLPSPGRGGSLLIAAVPIPPANKRSNRLLGENDHPMKC